MAVQLGSPVRGAIHFYLLLAGGILVGFGLDLGGFNAVQMLYWTAVVNGVLAPPLLVLVMIVGGSKQVMGHHANGVWLHLLGWASVAVMTAAAVAMFIS